VIKKLLGMRFVLRRLKSQEWTALDGESRDRKVSWERMKDDFFFETGCGEMSLKIHFSRTRKSDFLGRTGSKQNPSLHLQLQNKFRLSAKFQEHHSRNFLQETINRLFGFTSYLGTI
jgi:hypothetical protein